ncbi:uncharacterized protein LOC131152812 isoform X2 [Malania oleifera]|uniref:uncharacterized protein LOC131152812 isoform X2 n=1 Tax=Malania oleifera TaxID=397392 RepID=UPI0025AEBB18|nr:uncharacterized protein LOC131152812 isoform X2 [Malania oleifera]
MSSRQEQRIYRYTMHKLARTTHGILLPNFKNQLRSLKIFTLAAHLHNTAKTQLQEPTHDFLWNESEELQSSNSLEQETRFARRTEQSSDWSYSTLSAGKVSTVQVSHPWPEWVQLMELLLNKGYFEWGESPLQDTELGVKHSNVIRTACLNFARDRFDLIRFISRKDISVVVESGCPSIDRKVVNSAKRLRGYLGIDERNVCSSCMLRGNCDRAYVKAHEAEGARTVDAMRILLTYGLDYFTGSVENKPSQSTRIKDSVRRLLKEMLVLSTKEPADSPLATSSKRLLSLGENLTTLGQINVPMKQGDWHCPKCNFINFARNIKCLRCDELCQDKVQKLGEDLEHLPLKKGDWICDKCHFLNFAKNTRCMQCKEKPSKRQLNPGEWECDSCNYINFRKNMVCLKCDYRRPKSSKHSDNSTQPHNANGGFVRDEAYDKPLDRRDGTSRSKDGDFWRFVENESEDHHGSHPNHEILGFVDFPITGGKSELSRSVEKRERWKIEMAARSRHSSKTTENVDKPVNLQRRLDFLKSTDDDEMAEWFGAGKADGNKKTETSV